MSNWFSSNVKPLPFITNILVLAKAFKDTLASELSLIHSGCVIRIILTSHSGQADPLLLA